MESAEERQKRIQQQIEKIRRARLKREQLESEKRKTAGPKSKGCGGCKRSKG